MVVLQAPAKNSTSPPYCATPCRKLSVPEQSHRAALPQVVHEGIQVGQVGIHGNALRWNTRTKAAATLFIKQHLMVIGKILQRLQVAVVRPGAAMQRDDQVLAIAQAYAAVSAHAFEPVLAALRWRQLAASEALWNMGQAPVLECFV